MKAPRLIATVASITLLGALIGGCSGSKNASDSSSKGGSVTIYSADGLGDWYKQEFATFTKNTGIKVNYVEAGSAEVVSRIEKEKSNAQADVVVTLPPFIQQADKDGMLTDLGVDTSAIPDADKDSKKHWSSLVDNYSCWILKKGTTPAPKTWDDLLDGSYKGKLQYSTPGQAGDGTAVLILLEHELGKDQALSYLKKLQANNVGPSSSTGKLQPKVSSGELLVANGDVQMNMQSIDADKSDFTVFFPANGSGAPETVALPYAIGLTSDAPDAANGKKLIEFLLSKDVQQTIPTVALGYPVRNDVQLSGDNGTKLQNVLHGVQVYHPDWNAVSDGLQADLSAYNAATGG